MIRFIIIAICLGPVAAFTQEATEDVSADLAMSAIDRLRADPTSADAHRAASTIIRFAQESSDVLVVVGPNYVPWEVGNIDRHAEAALLAAYVAGSVEYQIENQVKESRPREGILFLVQVYESLRSAGAVEEISKLEEWLQTVSEGREIDVPPPE